MKCIKSKGYLKQKQGWLVIHSCYPILLDEEQEFSKFETRLGYTRPCLKKQTTPSQFPPYPSKKPNKWTKTSNNKTYLSPIQPFHSKLLQSLAWITVMAYSFLHSLTPDLCLITTPWIVWGLTFSCSTCILNNLHNVEEKKEHSSFPVRRPSCSHLVLPVTGPWAS